MVGSLLVPVFGRRLYRRRAAGIFVFRENSYFTVQDNLDLFVAALSGTEPLKQLVCTRRDGSDAGRHQPGQPEQRMEPIQYFVYIYAGILGVPDGVFFENPDRDRLFCSAGKGCLSKSVSAVPGNRLGGWAVLWTSAAVPGIWNRVCIDSARSVYFTADLSERGKMVVCTAFVYPFLSYFSYFGFFLLAYLVCAVVIVSIRDKKFCGRLAVAVPVLAAGYVCFEYRLFGQMLFSDVKTIRETMVESNLNFSEVLGQIREAFLTPVFHAASDHAVFVLPVCVIVLVWQLVAAVQKKNLKKFKSSALLWVLLLIVFNCLVYGLYFQGDFRGLFETLLPPLKGFQFNRTVFFNPFLWYAALFLALKALYDTGKLFWKRIANLGSVHCSCCNFAHTCGLQ